MTILCRTPSCRFILPYIGEGHTLPIEVTVNPKMKDTVMAKVSSETFEAKVPTSFEFPVYGKNSEGSRMVLENITVDVTKMPVETLAYVLMFGYGTMCRNEYGGGKSTSNAENIKLAKARHESLMAGEIGRQGGGLAARDPVRLAWMQRFMPLFAKLSPGMTNKEQSAALRDPEAALAEMLTSHGVDKKAAPAKVKQFSDKFWADAKAEVAARNESLDAVLNSLKI